MNWSTTARLRGGLLCLSLTVSGFVSFCAEPDPGAPLSPAEAVKRMTMPDGFRVTVFAAEPDLVQPIAMTTDDRGRLWVIESLTYPIWQTNNLPGQDRVVIFEDKDGDGRRFGPVEFSF